MRVCLVILHLIPLAVSAQVSEISAETLGESQTSATRAASPLLSESASPLRPIEVLGEDAELDVRLTYESPHSEVLIPTARIRKSNASSVGELLQKVPGVSVTGGAEEQNKRVSIRGLDGYRVIQQVDGAERTEATQSLHSSNLGIEPEFLSHIRIKNGADSVDSASGAIGGVVQYKTLSPDELLQGHPTRTRFKMGVDSATDGQNASLATAAKVGEWGSILLGLTSRESQRVQAGSPQGAEVSRQEDEVQSTRRAFLTKVQRKSSASLSEGKIEFSEAKNKNASYLAGAGESNSDYAKSTIETVVEHRQSLSSQFLYHLRGTMNETRSLKDTHSAYRGLASTLGRNEDTLLNSSARVSGTWTLSRTQYFSTSTDVGIESLSSRISEDDGTNAPEYGTSQGRDHSVFAQTSLGVWEDLLEFRAGGRWTAYHRQSDKLSLASPSRDDHTFSGMIGLAYAPTDWFEVSTKYSLSNRAPNVREMYYGGGRPWSCHRPAKICTSTPNPTLDEESARSREVSLLFKGRERFDESLLKVTYFDESIADYIEWMPEMFRVQDGARVVAGPREATHRDYRSQNLSAVLRRGLEAQAQTKISNWRLGASYAMIRMDCVDCPELYSATTLDEPLASAPADKIGFSAEYLIPSRNLELGVDAQLVSEQSRLSDRYLRAGYATPGYEVYGLSVMWSPKLRDVAGLTIDVDVTNLFDRNYTVHNSPSGTFELGRNVSLSVAAVF